MREIALCLTLLAMILWLAPEARARDEAAPQQDVVRLSAAEIAGPAERALVERVGAMIPRLFDPGGRSASLRVAGTVRSEREGAAYRITYPNAAFWSGGGPEIYFGNISLTVTPVSEHLLEFAWPLPKKLVPSSPTDPPLFIEAGSIEGLWDDVAGHPKRLAAALRNAAFSQSESTTPDLFIETVELRFAQSDRGTWDGTLDLAVSNINLAAIMGAKEGPEFHIGPFSIHAEGTGLDIAALLAAGAGAPPPDGQTRAGLGQVSLSAEVADVLLRQPDGSSFAADQIDLRAAMDFAQDPGRISAAMRLDGTSWGELPGLPALHLILPTFVDLDIALERIPVLNLLSLMAEQSARATAAAERHAAGEDGGWDDTPEPVAAEPNPLRALGEAGTELRLDHLTLGREEMRLNAEGALRFAPAGSTAPVFGTINYHIEKLGGFIGDIVYQTTQKEQMPGTDLVLVLLILLEGFGEAASGEANPDGTYSYSYEILETGEFLINGIPFDPKRLGPQTP